MGVTNSKQVFNKINEIVRILENKKDIDVFNNIIMYLKMKNSKRIISCDTILCNSEDYTYYNEREKNEIVKIIDEFDKKVDKLTDERFYKYIPTHKKDLDIAIDEFVQSLDKILK